jgi:D-3-phosphoglycerate dehydrogenase
VNASERYEGTRIAIVNANIPSMVAKISSRLADKSINILSLINQSRDEIAYTLLDVEGNINSELLAEIAKIDGILQLRKF